MSDKISAVYIRVSTAGQNATSQRAELKRWCEGNGMTNVKYFTDKATGDNLNRPAFEKLQQAVFNGEVATVVVFKLDRLSRSLKDGINTLCDLLDRGVRVVSTTQQLDFAGATGKLIASTLFAVAEMEQETRKERQAVGIANAKAKGVYTGRQVGSTKAKPAKAKALKAKGLSITDICETMSISRPTAYRYLNA